MIFSSMISVNMYTRNMKMEQKWQKRIQEKDYTSKDNGSSSSGIDPALQRQLEDLRDGNNSDAKTKEAITAKMRAGKKLSSAEMKYLQEKDPATYQKAKELEMTRQKYEQELKRCKTKEDVQRVKMSYAAQSMETVNSVSNNPNIPAGKKLQLIAAENQKMNAVADTTNQFVKDGHYAKLPTEAEQLKAEKDMKEALEAERDKQNDIPTPEEDSETSGTAETETMQEEQSRVHADSHNSHNRTEYDGTKKAPTRTEARYSPEAVKVRRARAKANYEKNSGAADLMDTSANIPAIFDTKA